MKDCPAALRVQFIVQPALLELCAESRVAQRRLAVLLAPCREAREQLARLLHRVRVGFAIQEKPIGTADAVLAAESFVQKDRFLVMNADNYYPIDAYTALRLLGEPGLIGFERDALLADGRIAPERIMKFALLDIDAALRHGNGCEVRNRNVSP